MMDFRSYTEFLAWERETRDIIDYKLTYCDMAGGDPKAGLALSILVYWHLPSKDGGSKLRIRKQDIDGEVYEWVAIPREEWWERARLSPYEADQILKKLREIGLIRTAVKKFRGKTCVHIRIVGERFMELWQYYQDHPLPNPYLKDEEPPATPAPEEIPPAGETENTGDPQDASNSCPELGNSSILTEENTNSRLAKNLKPLTETPAESTSAVTARASRGVIVRFPHSIESITRSKAHQGTGDSLEEDESYDDHYSSRRVPAWRVVGEDDVMCRRGMEATGRSRMLYASKKERTRWLCIKKGMMPLDAAGRVEYPTQWVEKLITWAAKKNEKYQEKKHTRAVCITFENLLTAIENTERCRDWIARAIQDPANLPDVPESWELPVPQELNPEDYAVV